MTQPLPTPAPYAAFQAFPATAPDASSAQAAPSHIDLLQKSYDEFPYASNPFPLSTPEHLQAVARLFALESPAPATARVLEIGCSAGGNILPFALRHPQAQVVGIDLSPVQIAQAEARVAQLGLVNVTLHCMNLEDVTRGDTFGEFDYIICHGVYSWVPPAVQEAIFRICRLHLSPTGVAYISYNTYPGWKSRELVRDAMRLRAEGLTAPGDRLGYARGMVDFLAQMSGEGTLLRRTMDEIAPLVRQAEPSYLLHDFLDPFNQPVYVRDFVTAARLQGVSYLGDAEPNTMFVSNHGAAIAEPLLKEVAGDQVLLEQYMDFLTNRTFRQSLLIHPEQRRQVDYQLKSPRIQRLHYAWAADTQGRHHPTPANDPQIGQAIQNALDGMFPATVSFAELCAAAKSRARERGMTEAELRLEVSAFLEELIITGQVRYAASPVTCAPAAKVADGSALTFHAAALQPGWACNIWHEPVSLTPVEHELLQRMAEPASPAELRQHLADAVAAGRLQFMQDGQPVTDEAGIAAAIKASLTALHRMRRFGLLV